MSDPIQKPGAILPKNGISSGPLLMVVAIMCYLAALALGAALGINRIAGGWAEDLDAEVTVKIRPTPDMPIDDQVEAALRVAENFEGVLTAKTALREELEELLRPYIGADVSIDDLPVPKLIFIRINPDEPPDLPALNEELKAAAPGAALDDHRQWNERLAAFAFGISGIGFGVLILMGMATTTIIVFATRAGLMSNQDTVEVLHMVGAYDSFIADEFQSHFLWLGVRGGLLGVSLGLITFFLLSRFSDGEALFLIPAFTPTTTEVVALASIPIAAAIVTTITARRTVLAVISRLT